MNARVIPIALIPTWSYSRLKDFGQCPLRAHLKYAQKIAEPDRPLPPGKTEHANDRGTRIHTLAEDFVTGKIEKLPKELIYFRAEFEKLQRLYQTGAVSLEGEWGMTRDWEPTGWHAKDVWQRSKLDALVYLSSVEAVVIDYKTGKMFGNEVAHAEQGQLYQLDTFLRHPELEVVHTEFWYLDQNEIKKVRYMRSQGLRFRKHWDDKANAMTSAIEFPAKANIFNCKWCGYGPWGTGHCERGVR